MLPRPEKVIPSIFRDVWKHKSWDKCFIVEAEMAQKSIRKRSAEIVIVWLSTEGRWQLPTL
jgi:hypothetical protein